MSKNKENCWLEEGSECPGTEILSLEAFALNEEEMGVWEGGDLIKKFVSVKKFLEDVVYCVIKGIPHYPIRKIERKEIAEVKLSAHTHKKKNCACDAL